MNNTTKFVNELLRTGTFFLVLLFLGRLLIGAPAGVIAKASERVHSLERVQVNDYAQARLTAEDDTATPTPFFSFFFPDVSNPPYTPIPTLTPTPTLRPTATQPGPKSIQVDISEQRLYAYEGGQLAFEFPVSTGANNTTLTGSFTILDKERNAWSGPWGFWMPYWMGIYYVGYNLENGMHGLPVYPNGREIWGDKIGTPVSYGCVVLRTDEMRQIYEWAPIGTPLQIRK